MVDLLLENGAKVNILCSENSTALNEAALCGNVGMVKSLIQHGASINCNNDRNETPLHLAIGNESDSKEIVELLLQNKADAKVISR